MSETSIVLSGSNALMPAMDMRQAQLAYQAMVEFVKGIMKEGTDFGTIPGTPKPTLYKPGAEKLARFFGLAARFDITKEIEQWGGEEPFFYYRYKCILSRLSDGVLIAEGEGSCNSHEKKYRYRNAERICPNCGKPAIIKGKKEYGGGWLCFGKKGGCGTKFSDDQFSGEVEQVINPDVADLVNTIQKMAQKRALIAATLIACNASEYFTQDVEDLDYGMQVITIKPEVDASTGEVRESARTEIDPPEAANIYDMNKQVCDLSGKDIHDLKADLLTELKKTDPKMNDVHFDARWKKRFDVKAFNEIDATVLECWGIMMMSHDKWLLEVGDITQEEYDKKLLKSAGVKKTETPTLDGFFGNDGPSEAYQNMTEAAK